MRATNKIIDCGGHPAFLVERILPDRVHSAFLERKPRLIIAIIDRRLLPGRDERAVGLAGQFAIEIGSRSLHQCRVRGVVTSQSTTVVSASGSTRPKPGTGSHEIVATNRPFAACGNLRPTIMEPSRTARSAQMPLEKSVR